MNSAPRSSRARLLRLIAFGALACAGMQGLCAKNYWSRASGDWNSDIWATIPGTSPVEGLRPGVEDSANLGLTGATITFSNPVHVHEFSLRADNVRAVITPGADVRWHRFFGQRDRNAKGGYNGVVEMLGGKLLVEDRFIIAGYAQGDIGRGTFHQKGGEVTLLGALHLTQFAVTGTSIATGIYSLSGGTLNIPTNDEHLGGIRSGIGKGRFEWDGGTLNCTRFFGNIHNAGSGNLSPGGDGEVGLSILHALKPKVYAQSWNASMTVDIASDTKYDRLFWQAAGGSQAIIRKESMFKIYLLNGYQPAPGTSFDVIVADRLTVEGNLRLGGSDGKYFTCEKVKVGNEEIFRLTYRGRRAE